MATCEMCGKDVPATRRATVEGMTMSVCGGCVKFGVEIAGPKQEVTGRSTQKQALDQRARSQKRRDVYAEMEEELVPDYGQVVQRARQQKGLTHEELGDRISERVPVLQNVEKGSLHPPDALVRKLEKELDITLMEKPERPAAATGGAKGKSGPLTIGDLIKEAKKNQDE